MAFVVRDLDRAIDYWTQVLGVGPFFAMRKVAPEQYVYKGSPSPSPTLSIALSQSGELQIELIQQHDERPSAYRDFLESGREGFQHVSSWLTRADYDRVMQSSLRDGLRPIHEGIVAGVGVRFAYFATETAPGGLVFEIADVMEPHIYPVMEMIAATARGWDGTDPVRELSL
jgi:catechol 2,3-dioxygenase-like lactoylglutathione lyase family enzyme